MENIIETPNKKNRMPPTTKSQMRKFKFEASDKDLMDLHRRIEETRWPERETVQDHSQGVQSETLKKLARYWATEYNWRKI